MRVPRLLASDLDGTLIDPAGSDATALLRFHDFVRGANDLVLLYVTGRSFDHALEGIESAQLPWPDHLGTSVGTELRVNKGSREAPRFELDRDFHDLLSDRLGPRPLDEADAVVLGHEDVRLQPAPQNHEFKRSYFVREGVEVGALARELQRELRNADFGCSVMSSVDPQTNEGLLDLLPRDVSKRTAIEVLRDRLRLDAGAVVFAGDSGNDLAALRGPWHGILVGNASEALRTEVRAPGRDASWPRVVLARQHVLHGVLEGLAELGWTKG